MIVRFHLSASRARLGGALALWLGLSCSLPACGDERREAASGASETPDGALDAGGGEADLADAADQASDAGGQPALDGDLPLTRDSTVDGGDAAATSVRPANEGDAGPARVDAASARLTVVRGVPGASYWDLRVRGVGLARFEGQQVVVRLGDLEHPDERLAAGTARVDRGSFELFFPQVWEAKLYKLKRAYVDVNGNGRCDPAQDLVFVDTRATQVDVLELREAPTMPSVTDFLRAWDPAEACAALDSDGWPTL